MKTKIQTSEGLNFGQEIKFGDLLLKFDRLGVAEVDSKETATMLVEKYEGWLFLYGEKPDKSKDSKKESEDVTELREEIHKLKSTVEDRESKLTALEEEDKEWKELVEKLKEEVKTKDFEFSEYKTQSEKVKKDLELNISLLKKTSKELVDICISMDIPEEKFKGINKDDLILLIIDESSK